MAKVARSISLDPEQARSFDVVAARSYAALSLLRSATSNGRADDKLAGIPNLLLKALDPSEFRATAPDGGPISIAAVVANVQSALGMRPNPDARQCEGFVRTSERNAKLCLCFCARQMFEDGLVPSNHASHAGTAS